MKNTLSNKAKVRASREQLDRLAEIVRLVQELFDIANASKLGPTFGVTKQSLQRRIDIKKGKKGGK